MVLYSCLFVVLRGNGCSVLFLGGGVKASPNPAKAPHNYGPKAFLSPKAGIFHLGDMGFHS